MGIIVKEMSEKVVEVRGVSIKAMTNYAGLLRGCSEADLWMCFTK